MPAEGKEASPRIAGLGEVLWDAFPDGEAFGGAPANFACHCRSLGADAAVVSCVGSDDRGRRAMAFLREHGVDTSGLAVDEGAETGVVLVTLDGAGVPTYEIKTDVAWDRLPWTDHLETLASRLNAVCFGSLGQRNTVSRETIQRFVAATPPGCLRVFDINLRQDFYNRDIILSSLQSANVLKLNDEELPVVASLLGLQGTSEEQLRTLIETRDLLLAVLTCGPRGALMMTRQASSFATPPDTAVVNTVGAGDAFTAAMVMGYLRGDPLERINAHATKVAAFVCTRQGAVPALPEDVRLTPSVVD